ncbi:dioxygenase [Ruegeria sp. HKCCD8929]|uniref:dioxygenase family protein n=1 Tax=Ruegeria sp. HKCCD8929 TaxID=2683006 RepID=UPI001487EC80|nr:dioxygenase [Ruegeria sp. HKCCD8929]
MQDINEIAYFSEENSASTVIDRMKDAPNERLKEVMTSVILHLHAVIKETEPTMAEWEQAIGFLTATGQICDDKRQEWILLSDVLGISMLVDEINNRRATGATENTVLGPFHVQGVPHREMGDSISDDGKGEPMFVHGRVLDTNGDPVDGAMIDAWQASHDGFYDNQQPDVQPEHNLRGIFTTGPDGKYWYKAIKPAYYGIPNDGPVGQMLTGLGRSDVRPAHLHYIIGKEGYDLVTTHIFDGDDANLSTDPVFGVRASLINKFNHVDDPQRAKDLGMPNPFWEVETDFILNPAKGS